MKTKQEILNMFPEHMDFWMGMNCGKIDVFIVSKSYESAELFMNKLRSRFKSFDLVNRYSVHESDFIKLELKDGRLFEWRLPDHMVRGYRFESLMIDADNFDFNEDELMYLTAHSRCGRDKIWFFDEV